MPVKKRWGSSPLARGTPAAREVWSYEVGLIPARAGNTRAWRPVERSSWAHPRSRGEHDNPKAAAAYRAGSSPLARGTLPADGRAGFSRGLIPARAGNTRTTTRASRHGGAHPCSRGEHSGSNPPILRRTGSSPLARGTLAIVMGIIAIIGLIPARAGNTGRIHRENAGAGAHPRSRGEHHPREPSTSA